uniref:Uncharacterized protein n=1 Tax=Anopheles coluzzii TaxID=1518534 RepID=A0A8W7PTR8_ANOCL
LKSDFVETGPVEMRAFGVAIVHESESASNGGGSNGPSSSYGPPRNTERIVGLMLEQPVQSIQLAEYWQGDQQPPSSSYGPPQ